MTIIRTPLEAALADELEQAGIPIDLRRNIPEATMNQYYFIQDWTSEALKAFYPERRWKEIFAIKRQSHPVFSRKLITNSSENQHGAVLHYELTMKDCDREILQILPPEQLTQAIDDIIRGRTYDSESVSVYAGKERKTRVYTECAPGARLFLFLMGEHSDTDPELTQHARRFFEELANVYEPRGFHLESSYQQPIRIERGLRLPKGFLNGITNATEQTPKLAQQIVAYFKDVRYIDEE